MEMDITVNLFELIDILFTDKIRWRQISDNCKRGHFFMLQRRLAIQYPDIVNSANINGIDTLALCEMYHAKLWCGRKPGWLYTKGGPKVAVSEQVSIPKENASWIKNTMSIDSKTWESICLRTPDWVYALNDRLEQARDNGKKKRNN